MPLTCIPGDILCGLGLAEILLWVLVFAIVFGILNIVKVFGDKGRKINALIALVAAFFVLMSVPSAVIAVITSMVNSFTVLAIALVVIVALLSIALGGGNPYSWGKPWNTIIAIILVAIAVLVFVQAGGLALIGLNSLPAIGINLETVVLVLVAIAFLWLIFGPEGSSTNPAQPAHT